MPLDDLLGDMHDDRKAVVREQLQELEHQILKRRLASAEISGVLLGQIEALSQQILQLQPEGGMADLRRRDREPLERERRDRQFLLQQERLQEWRDEQNLRTEQRHVLREGREEEQRYDRINGALYDA